MKKLAFTVGLLAFAVACSDNAGGLLEPTATTVVALTTGEPEGASAQVWTDKEDYQPGDTVAISGSGWWPGETVHLHITEDPQNHPDHDYYVEADEDGNFVHRELVMDDDHLGVTFYLTATGQESGMVAETTFTDGALSLAPPPTPSPFSPETSPGVKDVVLITVVAGVAPPPPALHENVLVRIRMGSELTGSLVREFALGDMAAGTNQIFVWDGKDGDGLFVPSGLYRARVLSDQQSTESNTPATVNRPIVVDNILPTVTINPVANGEVGIDMTITGTSSDGPDVDPVAVVDIDIRVYRQLDDADLHTEVIPVGTRALSNWSFVYTPAAGEEGETHCVDATATDAAGNTTTVTDCFDILDDDDPRLTTTMVECGPEIQEVNTNVKCTATVRDTDDGDAVTPEGMVTFTSTELFGIFSPEDNCLLDDEVAVGVKRCSVYYRSENAAVVEISAAYVATSNHEDSQSEDPAIVVFYDPAAGFVTGGGWFESPPRAYRDDPYVVGEARFGFVAQYVRRGTNYVPAGNTQFIFNAAGLKFHSNDISWLVVQGNDDRAMFKGYGSLNDVPEHGFLVSVEPGGADEGKFRIQIKDGDGNLVYDNNVDSEDDYEEPDTTIAGGSIVIHSGGQGKNKK